MKNLIVPEEKKAKSKQHSITPIENSDRRQSCALCATEHNLVKFKNRHICPTCIKMTKHFHEWDLQYNR